jgi:regulator of sigma E protease
MSWFLVFVGLCSLIVLHEAGHFVAAKATGMRVERFFLFFGPTLWSVRRGETEYGVKAIPLGGYVRITGMNPEEKLPPEVVPRAYYNQPVWKRVVVIAAGPVVNIVIAFAIFIGVFLISAEQSSQSVHEVVPKSPAVGVLHPGDRIVAVDGHRYPNLSTSARTERFREEIGSHECAGGSTEDGCLAATPVKLTIVRGGATRVLSVKPEYKASAGQPLIGFAFGTEPVNLSLGQAAGRAGDSMWTIASGTFHVFSHIFESKERKEISGIVGTSDVAHQAIDTGATEAFLLLAIISLSLGLINLLPILPLDGGHIFWSLVEKLRGQRVSLRTMERASVVGFALIAMLFFLGLSNDIGRLTGEGFKVR